MSAPRQGLLRAGLLLSLALMAGRLAGFARELMLASALGLSPQADVAIVLLTIPDLLVNLLLSGGLSVALIPALRSEDRARFSLLFAQASLAVTIGFGLLALVFVWQPGLWLGLLAPGISRHDLPAEPWIWGAVAVALPLTALSGVTSAALNARDRFFVAGAGTLVFNLCVIAALGLSGRHDGEGSSASTLLLLGLGIALGAGLRWLSQLLALRSWLQPQAYGLGRFGLLTRPLLRNFIAGLASASLLVLVPVLIRGAASMLGAGQLAAFNYAIKMVELPLGILITTLATVSYPRLSEAHGAGDRQAFDQLLSYAVQRSLVLSLAVLLCGWRFVDAVVLLLMGNGQLKPEELAHVTTLTQWALLSVPWVGLGGLLTAALNAQQRPASALRATAMAVLLLPLCCLPGLMLGRAELLMAAVPVMHVLLSLMLVWALGLGATRDLLQSASKIWRSVAFVALTCAAGVAADHWLGLSLGGLPAWQLAIARVLLAALVFGAAVALGVRALRPRPETRKD